MSEQPPRRRPHRFDTPARIAAIAELRLSVTPVEIDPRLRVDRPS